MILIRCQYSYKKYASPLLHKIQPCHMLFTSIIDWKKRGCPAEWEMMQEISELIEEKSGNTTKKPRNEQTYLTTIWCFSDIAITASCVIASKTWFILNRADLRNMNKQSNNKWTNPITINHGAGRDQLNMHSISLMTEISRSSGYHTDSIFSHLSNTKRKN